MLFINGKESDETKFPHLLRPFHLQAKGIFETVRIMQGKALFMDDHAARLQAGLHYLGMKNISLAEWEHDIQQSIDQSHTASGRLRYMVLAEEPQTKIIHITAHEPGTYIFPAGLTSIIHYTGAHKSSGDERSLYKLTGETVYAYATDHCRENMAEECFIYNDHNQICETLICNLYAIIENEICMPPLSSGCINGVMQKQFLSFLAEKNIPCTEKVFTQELIEHAEVLFGTNVVRGLRLYKASSLPVQILQEFVDVLNRKAGI